VVNPAKFYFVANLKGRGVGDSVVTCGSKWNKENGKEYRWRRKTYGKEAKTKEITKIT
jgi:hypothetical protein